MSVNDSSTGGALLPVGQINWNGSGPITFEGLGDLVWNGIAPPEPLEDDALDDFFHALVAGVTGIADELVRPRWQPEPPPLPASSVTWVAFGIMGRTTETFAQVVHDGSGWDILTQHEKLELLCSFYGPGCQSAGARLRDGLQIAQNQEPLFLAGMGLVETGDLTRAPELVKEQWRARADLRFFIRRQVNRLYAVRNIETAAVALRAGRSLTVEINRG